MLETAWRDVDLLLGFVKHAAGHDYVDYSTRRQQEEPRLTMVLERALRSGPGRFRACHRSVILVVYVSGSRLFCTLS
jgi:hypothetical protein